MLWLARKKWRRWVGLLAATFYMHSVPANPQSDQSQNCCGLFGVTAIAPTFVITVVPPVVAAGIAFTVSEDLFGRGFDRIDRPPRSLLSL